MMGCCGLANEVSPLNLALLGQGHAEVVLSGGVLRNDPQGRIEMADRFVELPLVLQQIAQIIVSFGVIGQDAQRFLSADGLLERRSSTGQARL
jgi:hypothetical protein